MKWNLSCTILLMLFAGSPIFAQEATLKSELPVVYQTNFSDADTGDRWELSDDAWSLTNKNSESALRLLRSPSNFVPKFRSPTHLALLRNVQVTEFQFDVRVRSTREDYDHRDVCFYFGYQSPTQYYYAHLAKKADDRANQVFIVNDADRAKISDKTTDGTAWDDKWHQVRITRNSDDEIAVFFDDMSSPIMTAKNDALKCGRVGVGSFDDTAEFTEITLRGNLHDK
jgi:hypothetical protein